MSEEQFGDVDAESIHPQETRPDLREKKIPVVELFGPVIQGEGIMAGTKTLFIRFGGCDYSCAKCDSMHAVHPKAIKKHAKYLEVGEIVEACVKLRQETGVRWITYSGGNPAIHDLFSLTGALKQAGFLINVETQGTQSRGWIHQCHVITVSPKSPGMGEKFDTEVFKHFMSKLSGYLAWQQICLKIVVFNQIDLEFALQVQELCFQHELKVDQFCLSLGNPFPPVLDGNFDLVENPTIQAFQENNDSFQSQQSYLLREYVQLSEEICKDPRFQDWRFLPQLHVLMYGNESER